MTYIVINVIYWEDAVVTSNLWFILLLTASIMSHPRPAVSYQRARLAKKWTITAAEC